MKVLHIVPGVDDIANGMAVVARFLAKEQGEAEVDDLNHGIHRIHGSSAEEVWIHGMWLPKEWLACWRTLRSGKRLVRMPHGSVDPVRLRYHGWKKWLVGPIERWCLRRCAKIVATCEAEKEWIEKYLGKRCPAVEVTDIKRFFDVSRKERKERKDDSCVEERGLDSRVEHVERVEGGEGSRVENGEVHLLYLGRRHPLKGVEYLEIAVAELNSNPVNPVNPVQNYSARLTTSALSSSPRLCVRLVSNAFGDELEKVWNWCDVLVLPTLSENFGLVVAEALERGKCVITTDGAPAWGENLSRVEHVDGGMWSGYGGRLIYLKGYREGTKEQRVELLRRAIELMSVGEMMAVS